MTSTLTPAEDVANLSDRIKSHLQASTRALREIQQENPTPKRKRTAKHYSKRHVRRLKKQRVEKCAAALSWLENDGLTPVSVTVFNTETKEMENITVRNCTATERRTGG